MSTTKTSHTFWVTYLEDEKEVYVKQGIHNGLAVALFTLIWFLLFGCWLAFFMENASPSHWHYSVSARLGFSISLSLLLIAGYYFWREKRWIIKKDNISLTLTLFGLPVFHRCWSLADYDLARSDFFYLAPGGVHHGPMPTWVKSYLLIAKRTGKIQKLWSVTTTEQANLKMLGWVKVYIEDKLGIPIIKNHPYEAKRVSKYLMYLRTICLIFSLVAFLLALITTILD